MKQYFNHIKLQTPHVRRKHATYVAGTVTAFAFLVWVTTLGLRYGGSTSTDIAAGSADQTMLAGVAASDGSTNQSGLQVVGTSTDQGGGSSMFSNDVTQY